MTPREYVRIPLAISLGTVLHIFVMSGVPFVLAAQLIYFAMLSVFGFCRGVVAYILDPTVGMTFIIPSVLVYWIYRAMGKRERPIRGREVLRDGEFPNQHRSRLP